MLQYHVSLEQSDSVMCVCVCVCVLFQILFYYELLQDIEYSSLCYIVDPY